MATGINNGQSEHTAAGILDFGKPLDVALLDATVKAFYESPTAEQVRDNICTCIHGRIQSVHE